MSEVPIHPAPFTPLPGQDWSLLHSCSSKPNFFPNPLGNVFEIIWSSYWTTRIVSATACWSWSKWSVIDQQWSVQIVAAWSHSAVWPCLRSGRWVSKTLSNMSLKEKKESSPTVFLMLIFELSLVPLKESSIDWLISPYINPFHTINPLFFFSDPSVGERWF